MLPILEVARKAGLPESAIEPYGKNKAKISLDALNAVRAADGKLILVTAITPTPAGEGKTTTTIGLSDALNRLNHRTLICLREPSLGPCFGMKGGATGGGLAQVIPMEDINLHFTGDFHAITSAHSLLAAMLDNHLMQGNALNIDPQRITWKRVVDMNDRALREIVIGLGGSSNGTVRESGFDITVASEVMAVFCLAQSLDELRERLGKIVVAYTRDKKPVTAADLKANGAMAVLLKDALSPNLVQTREGNPAFVHGGPFANIAHGCNSVIATKSALKLADYVVTEAGFGADLGAEKFLDIKCRKAGIWPSSAVIVATIRALKMHGGVDLKELKSPNPAAVERGIPNLAKHIENMQKFGLPVVVAINAFAQDTSEETAIVERQCEKLGVKAIPAEHFAKGGEGALDLAKQVVAISTAKPKQKLLYPDNMPLLDKIRTIAREIYGASDIVASAKATKKMQEYEAAGYGDLPVCMAKTQYSFSTDATLRGRPSGFTIPVRDVNLSAGAGFVVALAGEIMTMPGLPKIPAAENIGLDDQGNIVGLF